MPWDHPLGVLSSEFTLIFKPTPNLYLHLYHNRIVHDKGKDEGFLSYAERQHVSRSLSA